ncbi:hypothetical protein VP01_499g4 [Puccinia sorghi]|uniref:Uncharacterized protein n=1 Tax=Puccinia sorghi TaxID=27349 RepID=A0A0L6UMJ0_9BASI|nr:hypothetical protein VP01_499g4 [Puccinia sorghi]
MIFLPSKFTANRQLPISPIPRTTQRESRKQRERGKNTGIEEDQVLCSTSWLKTLQDAIIGTEQKKTTFWVRIHNLYVELIDKTTEKVLWRTAGITFSTSKYCQVQRQLL